MARAISSLIRHEFDPFEIAGVEKSDISASKQRDIAKETADFVAEQILLSVSKGRSPVAKQKNFDPLNSVYRKFKIKSGHSGKPDLEFEGDLLDSLVSQRITSSNNVEVGVSPSQEDKADGHNNFSGRSSLPVRRFIPDEGQTFKQPIITGIKDIVEQILGN